VKEAKEDGFLPCSFFAALTGQLVAHSQCVYDMSYDDMELSQREVVISFRKHKFRMLEMPEMNMFQITIQVETAFLIVDTILSVAAKTLASMTMAQGVKVSMTVPADGGKLTAGVTADGEKPMPNGYLVITDGEGGLQQRVDSNTPIALGPGADSRRSPFEGRRIFAPWLLPTGFRQSYDVFISYRWTLFDTEILQAIFPIISAILFGKHNRPVQPFLDRHHLQDGQNFSDEFSSALINSTGILPVVSCVALERMLSLTPESNVDKVLLEWTLALEIKDKKGTFFVLPLVVGKVSPERKLSNGSFSTSLFQEGIIQQLPQVVCNKTVAKAKAILLKHGMTPSANLDTHTVRQTVEEITSFLGVMTNDVKISDVGGSVDADSGHEYSMWRSAVYANIRTKVVECLEAAEIMLGGVRQQQEQEAEARRRKEERVKLEEMRRQQEEQVRMQREEEIRRRKEEEAMRKEEAARLEQAARAQAAAAARRGEEEELRKLLGDFDLSNEDLSKIAAADIKTVADLKLLEPEDVEAFAFSLVSRKKFVKLLEHVGAPAFLAAAAEQKRRAEEDMRRKEEDERVQVQKLREEKLRKLLEEFGLSSDDDLSKIAAADIKTVADLTLLEPEDVDAFAFSLVSRQKFVKLLEHVGAPAFKLQAEIEAAATTAAAAAEQNRQEEERVAKAAAASAAEQKRQEEARVAKAAAAAAAAAEKV
jgi:hypothetical protein